MASVLEVVVNVARLLEYQAKQILHRFGISVPHGQIVRSLSEARETAAEIGYPAMVKAQVRSGKRGKSGGVRAVANEAELAAVVSDMMGDNILGLPVDALLVEQRLEITREVFVGVTADPSSRSPIMIFCADGGVGIEETARVDPQAVRALPIDVLRGVYPYDALNLVSTADSLTSRQKLDIAQLLCRLYDVYRSHDCKLVEINPLALTGEGLIALDARVDIDGDALERQTELDLDGAEEAGSRSSTLLEEIAAIIDERDHRGTVHFVQIDPDLSYAREHSLIPFGFDCVGAGASLTTMDELVPLGFYPVNFCDSSGNPVGSKLYRVTKLIFSQPGIQGYVFVSCVSSQQLDNTARGIIKALKELYPETKGQPNIPTVLCFRGAWDEDALGLLARHGISEGRWVRVLGRDATERDAAQAFCALHREWTSETGGAL
jgi:succinyl-CoA synthetase beta subunit